MVKLPSGNLMGTIGILLLGVQLMTSCRHEPWLPDSMNSLCFDEDIRPIMLSNCAYSGCHDAQSSEDDIDLSTYNAVMASDVVKAGDPNGSEMYEVLFKSGSKQMPPSPRPRLSEDSRELIRIWIQQGARNECQAKNCDSTNVTYTSFIGPLTDTYCKSCHSNPNPSGGVPLETYADLVAVGTNGSYMGVLQASPGYNLMPPGGSLSACDIAKVKKWIREAYVN
jgi:hypothetical protein